MSCPKVSRDRAQIELRGGPYLIASNPFDGIIQGRRAKGHLSHIARRPVGERNSNGRIGLCGHAPNNYADPAVASHDVIPKPEGGRLKNARTKTEHLLRAIVKCDEGCLALDSIDIAVQSTGSPANPSSSLNHLLHIELMRTSCRIPRSVSSTKGTSRNGLRPWNDSAVLTPYYARISQ